MSVQGTIHRWDADRGFGFIRRPNQRDAFVHVRDVHGVVPAEGVRVEFSEIQVEGKGPRAVDVRPVPGTGADPYPERAQSRPGRGDRRSRGRAGSVVAIILMTAWIATLAWGLSTERVPIWLLGAFLLLNLITYAVYARDKRAARQGTWRTSEAALHLLAVLGGWPGAWLAQHRLRHKSVKQDFRVVYWLTVLVNCAAVAVIVFAGWSTVVQLLR